ncbi:MAG TPA: beta-propeller domain-containing protein [Pyrinomonadaceae bacterium]|nr:beta-propeller domain-containing protein [Pyrinomonadaceae bacterium]
MKTFLLLAITSLFVIAGLAGCAEGPVGNIPVSAHGWTSPRSKTMRAFRTEQELKDYLKDIAEKQKQERQRQQQSSDAAGLAKNSPASAKAEVRTSTGSRDDESVTNVQHAGVDEGGIVKLHGDHLVILRRGRLFTVKVGDGALQPVSAVDAFGLDIEPSNTWYDEMLVSEDAIAVIGYSYQRGGTEIGLFEINDAGHLRYRSTYHLRSNDYYSSRNYASRLIGNKLIFYTPLYLYPGAEDPFQSFPAVRKWHKGATTNEFRRIVSATNVYRSERPISSSYGLALHTVTVCDLANGGFACEATGVLGPAGRVFYVSPDSVYVWTSDWTRQRDQVRAQSMLYRMPLDGSRPSALGVSGSPIDQFSFLESDDDYLNVLVRSSSVGDGMWGAEVAAGDVALMRVPLSSFSDGSNAATSSSYRSLPKPEGYTFQNRFVADYLLYGTGSGWGYSQKTEHPRLYAVPWAGGKTHELSLAHPVDRIEQLGSDAVVVGTDGKNLHFTSVRLADSPGVVDRYTRAGASQGELRSHGFFYKPNGPDSGTLGLPISVPGRPGYRHLFDESAAILFLRNDSLLFEEMGELAGRPERAVNDSCRASCVDWYGNSRPLFVRGRVLALLGYEIVEGALDDNRMRELRRVSYAPRRVELTRRGEE